MLLLSDDEFAGDRRRRREDQSQGAARERLLRAFPGTDTSEEKIWDEMLLFPTVVLVVAEDDVSVIAVAAAGAVFELVAGDIIWRFCSSSLENDSSTKFESHSSSAKSSYGTQSSVPENWVSVKLRQLRLPLNWASAPETEELQLSTTVREEESPELPQVKLSKKSVGHHIIFFRKIQEVIHRKIVIINIVVVDVVHFFGLKFTVPAVVEIASGEEFC